jgi:hypothetical protein
MIQGFSGGLLRNTELFYLLDLPTFQRDFAQFKTLDHATGPAITFTRASNATFFDADGVLQTASNNVPRFDHDSANGNSLGLLIEEARTNSIRNSQAGGSTNGAIGSGGAVPTHWASANAAANGVSTEIIGTGTEAGLSYIDIKFSGTPSASSSVTIFFEANTQVVAANGQTWAASAYYKLVAGSLSNATVRHTISGRVAGGTSVAGQASQPTITPTSAALSTQRSSAAFAFTDATVERVNGFVNIVYTSGNPIDLTLRIAAPQLEQGAFPTSYIPTTSAAATRATDVADITSISSFYNQAEGTLFAEGVIRKNTDGTPLLFDDTTENEVARISVLSSGIPSLVVVDGGVSQAAIGIGSAITEPFTYKMAGAIKENDFQAALNGTLGTADTSGTMPTVTRLRIGRRLAATGVYSGHIAKIAYWPRRLSDTLLQQLTT